MHFQDVRGHVAQMHRHARPVTLPVIIHRGHEPRTAQVIRSRKKQVAAENKAAADIIVRCAKLRAVCADVSWWGVLDCAASVYLLGGVWCFFHQDKADLQWVHDPSIGTGTTHPLARPTHKRTHTRTNADHIGI